jgi:hypothetical protein
MKKYGFILLGIWCFSSAQAEIKMDMKPGLWENTVKLSGDSAQQMQAAYTDQMKQAMADMKKQMADMPPEQRKMMEDAMAASGVQLSEDGVVFDGGRVSMSKDATVVQNCVTKEELDKGLLPESGEDCESTLTQIDKKRFKSSEVCKGDSPSTSEAELQLHSPTHYTGKGKTIHTIDGKPVEMAFTMEGKWLGSDCGDVTPNGE